MARTAAARAPLAAAALSAALGAGCAAVGASASGAPITAASAGPAALAERLPAAAAGFRRGEARPAGGGGGGAGGGREVSYATGGGRSTAAATVELLNESTGAAAALDATLAEALRAEPAREMREAGRFALPVPAAAGDGAVPPLLCAHTAGRYGRERVAGLVCAGRVGGALLRIRVTMPAREPAPADPRAFAEEIAATLSGGRAVAGALARSG